MPKISVLMPVYNAERYLALAVESVLAQTYRDFEFLIIDDGSQDRTAEILDGYQDERIVRVRNESNLGIVRTLNKGLTLASGDYIARMDADDICLPHRFELQAAYLDRHPECVLAGTRIQLIDEDGNLIYPDTVVTPREIGTPDYIQWSLLWATAITHPSSMFRRQTVEERDLHYEHAFETAEDYQLWTQFARWGAVTRLPEVGLYYRINSQSISAVRTVEQFATHYRITRREVERLLDTELPAAVSQTLFEVMVRQEIGAQFEQPPAILGTLRALVAVHKRFLRRHAPTDVERAQIKAEVLAGLDMLYEAAKTRRDIPAMLAGNRYLLQYAPRAFLRRLWLSVKYRTRLLIRKLFAGNPHDSTGES